jgi:hypothetical protein
MVMVQEYFKKSPVMISKSPLPYLNSLFSENFSLIGSSGEDSKYQTFMKWARKNPHIMGFVNVLITDIISDKVYWECLNTGLSGRNKILRSELFWNSNNGLEILEQSLYDWFLTGQLYNWIGKIDKKIVSEAIQKIQNKEGKSFELKAEDIIDDLDIAKKLRHIPSSTVSIKNDETKITGFVQRVGVNMKLFDPDEVIFSKFMPLDGKVYGFAPMECLLAEIYLLYLITQNYTSYFENGGHPDKVFVLPKEIAGSKNHEYLIETLKKYKKIQNKHGNLVFTGDIKIEDLMKFESQMEHKELSLYVTGVLAMFYGIPSNRIPFLIGKAASTDQSGLADSGYWRKISVWQSKIENAYNSKLFNPFFGTNIKFSRGYKQDEVRETQTHMQKTQVAEQRMRLGLWTIEETAKYLGIDYDVIMKAQEEKKVRDEEMMKSGMMNQNLNNNKQVQFEEGKVEVNARRSNKQVLKKEVGQSA